MQRKAKERSPLEVRRLNLPGRWSVGGVDGLALQVTESGERSWVLRLECLLFAGVVTEWPKVLPC